MIHFVTYIVRNIFVNVVSPGSVGDSLVRLCTRVHSSLRQRFEIEGWETLSGIETGFTFLWLCELRGQMISFGVPAYRRSLFPPDFIERDSFSTRDSTLDRMRRILLPPLRDLRTPLNKVIAKEFFLFFFFGCKITFR